MQVRTVAQGLTVPWALDVLPNGHLIVSERPGTIRTVDPATGTVSAPIWTLPVHHVGEGGLLGLALHPEFARNGRLFVYYTYWSGRERRPWNRVAELVWSSSSVDPTRTSPQRQPRVVVDRIPAADFHNGGRLWFRPSDGFLYITTGDALDPMSAQDPGSLAGKILRVTDRGEPAPGNPWGTLVYSLGHRNSQGLAEDGTGQLWSTEHGDIGHDELNAIEPGGNYGWPLVQGDEQRPGLIAPVLHSDTDTWAPAGAAFLNGSVYFGGLRGESLYEAMVPNGANQKPTLRRHLPQAFGRIRDVIVGPDGQSLFLTTSNRDGRGQVNHGDDRILQVTWTR